ncbi:MAG: AmmeMemoRadiSam system protein A, partial [Elusimicrobiaceae bacterium]
GKVYGRLDDDYTTVLLIGTGHNDISTCAVVTGAGFQTPLGVVETDSAAVAELLKNPLFVESEKAHAEEHSIEVQLPFLQVQLKGKFKIVPVLLNNASLVTAREVGSALARTLKNRKTLCVISSDLSHYPDKASAELVDKTILKSLEFINPEYFDKTDSLLMQKNMDGVVCAVCGKAAVEAGLAFALAKGANRTESAGYANSADSVHGDSRRTVGYGGMFFFGGMRSSVPSKIRLDKQGKLFLLETARKAIATYMDRNALTLQLSPLPELNLPAPVFVTLTLDGKLRGCVGDTEAQDTLLNSVAYFARAAAFSDSRFPPLEKSELEKIKIEISVLSNFRPVKSWKAIRAGKEGVIITKEGKTGLFLPQVWKEIPAMGDFLSELCEQKAHLKRDCYLDPDADISVFTVDKFKEKGK